MSEVVFTFPGKLGDAIMQFPVAYQWYKAAGKKFTCWMDEKTCKPLKPLLEAQPCVDKVEFKEGIENYSCGGQPFHFGLSTKDYQDRTVYHLGLRSFPQRQLTLQCLEDAKLPTKIDQRKLSYDPCFYFPEGPIGSSNRLVLHGQSICPHTKSTPGFWKFLSDHAAELSGEFEEIVFVGNDRDIEIGTRTYPNWQSFNDDQSFLTLGRFVSGARCVIGVGSSIVALAGALKIPCVRVHDPIGTAPRTIWDNLGPNQLNRTEFELRTDWPAFRDRWVRKSMAEVVGG